MSVSTYVKRLPACDVCMASVAAVDGRTKSGRWANMCEDCFSVRGIGLGLGRGQRLTTVKPKAKAKQAYSLEDLQAMLFESVLDSTPCTSCGSTQRVEPDARGYTCHDCGEGTVESPLVSAGLV